MPPEDDSAFGEFVPPQPGEIDSLLPDYDVLELIAQGGMGAIYRGLQTKLDRLVAIKVLPKQFGADLDYAARFEQEAKAMAKLSHGNIVGVYDYGETIDGAHLYFIMEYVEGSDLFHLLREKKLSYVDALPVLRQICDALGYAHENGIVHRDIKPANILIDTEGNVKMADFGLAKIQKGVGAEAEEDTAFGTPDYVAPETLIEGITIDHRADIYSLGVLIYEVLTGGVPKGSFDLPSVKNPAIDRRFDDIILKTVNPNRDERFSDIGEVRTMLDAIEKTPRLVAASPAATPAVPAVTKGGGPATRRRPRPHQPAASSGPGAGFVTLMLALVFCASAGAIYWFVIREPSAPPPDMDKVFAESVPGSATGDGPDPKSGGDSGESFFAPDSNGMPPSSASASESTRAGEPEAVPGKVKGPTPPRGAESATETAAAFRPAACEVPGLQRRKMK